MKQHKCTTPILQIAQNSCTPPHPQHGDTLGTRSSALQTSSESCRRLKVGTGADPAVPVLPESSALRVRGAETRRSARHL